MVWGRMKRNFSSAVDPNSACRQIPGTSPKLSLCATLHLCETLCPKGIKRQLSHSADSKPSGSARKKKGCNRAVRLGFESAPLFPLTRPASCSRTSLNTALKASNLTVNSRYSTRLEQLSFLMTSLHA